jgi:hypothetical protein
LNASGAVLTGLTWTASDTTVVSLSTDDPPIITALAPGHVSITAGDASADVTVYSGYALPTGTVIWSAPGDGTGVASILPAVPSSTGVADVFALQDSGNVQAITTDGSVAWTASVGSGNTLLPDFQGGLVVASATSIQRLDGMTGQMDSQYTYAGTPQSNVAIHTNGTIFAVDGSSLVGINPATGTPIFTIPLDQSTSDQSNACYSEPDTLSSSPPVTGQLIIVGDGNAYLIYQYTQYSTSEQLQNNGVCDTASYDQLHLRLLQVDPSGDAQKIVIGDWNVANSVTTIYNGNSVYDIWTQNGQLPQFYNGSINIVTNADSGVVLALQYGLPGYCSYTRSESYPHPPVMTGCVDGTYERRLIAVSGGSVASNTLLTAGDPEYGVTPMLQGQDGNYFGVGLSSANSMDHFDQNGNVLWSVPNFTPVIATADGGVVAQSATGQYMTFDQNGVANGMLASLPTQSWTGDSYQLGSQIAFALPGYADSFAAMIGNNNSANGTATEQTWFPLLQSCYDPTLNPPPLCPGPYEVAHSALTALRSFIPTCSNCTGIVFQPLGTAYDEPSFSRWLNHPAKLYDGLRSKMPLGLICTSPNFSDSTACRLQYGFETNFNPFATVSDFFETNFKQGITNITQTPNPFALVTFYDPRSIYGVCAVLASGSSGFYNQSVLFHEALHGFYGKYDPDIQEAFGLSTNAPSDNITDYIFEYVFHPGVPEQCGN